MKNKKLIKYKYGDKNKKIKRKKTPIYRNYLTQHKTETSIKNDSELQESRVSHYNIKQYKQQQDFIKKYFKQLYYDNNFSNSQIFHYQQILENLTKIQPISLNKLFDQRQAFLFNGSFIYNDILQFVKILNNQFFQKRKKIILSSSGYSLNVIEQFNKQEQSYQFKGKFITELEREVYQNHQNFIEKIKQNQLKYSNQKSQLSQISLEMIFLSKVYLNNVDKIKNISERIAGQIGNLFQQPQNQTEKIYYEVVMKKNIAYAFNEDQIDYFNYFKQRQFQQRNLEHCFNKIQDKNQLLNYLKNKKPKKTKLSLKHCLSTACSCCFSDYHQDYNPLISCDNCTLRCHKLCYNFKQKSCGACSYQRIQKTDKQLTEYCFICKQKGQMTIKLNQEKYAHGFCLLFHNFWKVNIKKVFLQNDLQSNLITIDYKLTQNSSQQNLRLLRPQQENQFFKESNSELKNQLNEENIYNCLVFANENRQKQSKPSVQLVKSINQLNCERSQKVHCNICSSQIHKQLYVQCTQCQTKMHAFCAFFEGLEFKRINNPNYCQSKINILFDCCSKSQFEKEKLRKKREFILNKNRFLFQNSKTLLSFQFKQCQPNLSSQDAKIWY